MILTSPANPHLKKARGVREGKEPGLMFVEGERLGEDCVQSGIPLFECFHTPDPGPRAAAVIEAARARGCPVFAVEPEVLDVVADTVNSQGLILLAERPRFVLGDVMIAAKKAGALLVCLDAVQDPGNFGAIVRTAEAAGAAGVLAIKGSVDAYAPKALRASMGSAFRLPVVTDVWPEDLPPTARALEIDLIGTTAEAPEQYDRHDWRQPGIIMFGNEANGVRPELLAQCARTIGIPIHPPVNSLNVAISVAVILFEAERQRRLSGTVAN
ncbi:MAG: TrmH family RNA methyltransferase [Blastocatellia bacterium]